MTPCFLSAIRGAAAPRLARSSKSSTAQAARRIREALRDIGDAGSNERKRMSDDLESVRLQPGA
ncbi:MAG: hypothetical protein U0263_39250 [Polyangiaceae bacterium]